MSPFLRLRAALPLGALVLAACGSEAGSSAPAPEIGTAREPLKSCGGPDYVEGIDVSHYETVDFGAVKSGGVAFSIMKATEGTGYVDPTFASYWAAAKAHGLVRGAYHFHRADYDPKTQIDHFLANVTPEAGDLPLILDVEDVNTSLSPSAITANVLACLQYLEQKTGRTPMIYTGMWYWSGNMNSPLGFSKYPMWMSSYPGAWAAAQNHTACPTIPDDFSSWAMWQYSDGAQADAPSIPGVGKSCDRNFFNGTLSALLAFANGGPTGAGAGGSSAGAGGSGASAGSAGAGAVYAAKYVAQSWPLSNAPAIKMKVGETLSGSIDLKNTGNVTWPAGVVKLAPIPRDKPSPFYAPSWSSPTRVSSPSADVPVGSVGHFSWDLSASQAGDFSPYFGLVAGGIVWFADAGGPPDSDIQVHVVVVPGGATGAGGTGAGGSSVGAGGAAAAAGNKGVGGSSPGAGLGGAGAGALGGNGAGAGPSAGGASSAGGKPGSGGGKPSPAGGASAGIAAAGGPTNAAVANVVTRSPDSSGGCALARADTPGRGGLAGLGIALAAWARRTRRGKRRALGAG